MNRLPIIAAAVITCFCGTAQAQDTQVAPAPAVTAEVPDSLKNVQPHSQTLGEALKGTSSGLSRRPLIVVDGVPITDEIVDKKPSLLDTKVTDIESITVLKSPSDLSYYGRSGASGVILITTKHVKGN